VIRLLGCHEFTTLETSRALREFEDDIDRRYEAFASRQQSHAR
jgi:hypothetical protein